MEIIITNNENECVVSLIGRLDSQSAPEIEGQVMEAADQNDKLVLDLTKLEYTSSAGLRIIRNLQVKMTKKGGELLIKGTNKIVMEVFEMTGFASFLKFVD